jgi:L-lactate dehydrogenase complex protein LldG
LTRIQGDNAAVETAQAGITGCDAAIAATGTLVLRSGPGRSRMASLLPPLHIALVHTSQLLPRLEDWVATQTAAGLDEIRAASNVTLIIGCSRTADIEMSPVFGVHGPLAFHVILIGA